MFNRNNQLLIEIGYAQFVYKNCDLKLIQSFETAIPNVVVNEMLSPWEN